MPSPVERRTDKQETIRVSGSNSHSEMPSVFHMPSVSSNQPTWMPESYTLHVTSYTLPPACYTRQATRYALHAFHVLTFVAVPCSSVPMFSRSSEFPVLVFPCSHVCRSSLFSRSHVLTFSCSSQGDSVRGGARSEYVCNRKRREALEDQVGSRANTSM